MISRQEYQVNKFTKALIPIHHPEYQTKILDVRGEFFSEKTCKELLTDACIRQLTTFEGALAAVRKTFLYKKLTPLVVNKQLEIIAIPTVSPSSYHCIWFFASHVHASQTLLASNQSSGTVYFHDHTTLPVPLSFHSLKKKLAQAAMLKDYCRNEPNYEGDVTPSIQ
ncbi:competence protein [Priestia megaterium]|nr:competence protein [Priestia megaterium]